jgi:hypothetical protein
MRRNRLQEKAFMRPWVVVLGIVLLTAVIAISLWHFHGLRPYLAGFGAGVAAFLAPLPGLLTPKMRGKWLLAIGIACLIGLGAWYSADDIERKKDRLELRSDQLDQRLQLQRELFASTIKNLPSDEQAKFVLSAATLLRKLYKQSSFESVLDVAQVLGTVDQENGHALYFLGEGYRSLDERTSMRGALQQYLQAADHHAEAEDGDAAACYQRTSGYCRERTAWINHLMANDYYQEARTSRGEEASNLGTAFNYEKHVLETRPHGFYHLASIESSCGLLQQIASELRHLGQSTGDIEAVLGRYRVHYGPC